MTGKPPFLGRDVKDTIRLIGTKPLRWPNPKKIPLSTNCKTFINRLLSKVPRYRATIAQALEHPWIVDNKNNPNVGAANLISSELLTNIADFHHAGMCCDYLIELCCCCSLCCCCFFHAALFVSPDFFCLFMYFMVVFDCKLVDLYLYIPITLTIG